MANGSSSKAAVSTQSPKSQTDFVGTNAKSPTIDGDAGKEIIKIKDGASLTGKARFNLGSNQDKVVIDGIVNNLIIDNGDDDHKDITKISSPDLIQKKVKLNNFGEEDKLTLEGVTFKYQDIAIDNVSDELRDVGVVVNLVDL